MIDTIIFDVGRVLVNWDYESYLKRFAFGPEKTKAITAATFESPYWRQFDRGILTPEEIVKGFCSLAPEYTEEIKEVFAHCEETITPLPYAESWVRSLKEKGYRLYILSNYSGDLFERTKEKMPFLPYMDGTLFSYTCHLTKPEAEIYQHLSRNSPSPRTAAYSSTTPKQTSSPQSRQGFMEFILRDMKMAWHS